ncbi:hypothetical protein JCM8097_005246 [Rhodosporidiobolus ruineniae]
MVNPRVFMDFAVEGQPVGRVMYELFADAVPKTAENFRQLCTGAAGVNELGIPRWYKGTPMHRIIAGFMVQGGDFTDRNGKGGESIYGRTFPDEDLTREIDSEGLLCMANKGKNTNGSQFFVTLRPCPHLKGKHVVFGRVVKGYETIVALSKLPTDAKDHPLQLVTISHCGELERKSAAKPARAPSPSPSDRSRSRSRSASVSSRGRSPSRSPSRARDDSRDRSLSPDRQRSKRSRSARHRSRSPGSGDDSAAEDADRERRERSSSGKHRSSRRHRDRSGSRERHRSSKHKSSRSKRSKRDADREDSPPLLTEAEIAALEKRAAEEAAAAAAAKEEEARQAEERRREALERKRRAEEEAIARGGVVYKGRGRMKGPGEGRGAGMRGW